MDRSSEQPNLEANNLKVLYEGENCDRESGLTAGLPDHNEKPNYGNEEHNLIQQDKNEIEVASYKTGDIIKAIKVENSDDLPCSEKEKQQNQEEIFNCNSIGKTENHTF